MERTEWIKNHGSDELKKSVKIGYKCSKQYAKERASMEFGEVNHIFHNGRLKNHLLQITDPTARQIKREEEIRNKYPEYNPHWYRVKRDAWQECTKGYRHTNGPLFDQAVLVIEGYTSDKCIVVICAEDVCNSMYVAG